jgi:excisionase family DNA binding protein
LLTINETAEALGVSRHAAYRMVRSGVLPAVRKRGSNRILVDPAGLDAIETAQPVRPDYSPTRDGVAPHGDVRLLTVAEVSAMLRCGPETVRRLVKAGQLTAVRNPGRNAHLRIHSTSVDAYLRPAVDYALQPLEPVECDEDAA